MSVPNELRQWVPDRLAPLLSVATFAKFVSVGVVGAVADTAVLLCFSLLFAAPELMAKAAGIEVAVIVMFLLNERWTFTDQSDGGTLPFLRRLVRSHVVRVGGVGVQLAVFWALVGPYRLRLVVTGTDIWFVVASLVSIAVATAINYVCESMLTWQVQATETTGHGSAETDD